MNKWVPVFPMMENIRLDYLALRERKNRKEAVEQIKKTYAEELQDEDDMAIVMIGLAVALGNKKELTKEIADQTMCAIENALKKPLHHDARTPFYNDAAVYLKEHSRYGTEKPPIYRKAYVSNWKKGDTFYHILSYPVAEYLGIMGWSIILYNVGQYTDDAGKAIQLVYISLCEPGKEPKSESDMRKLCFMPVMCGGSRWDYLAQLAITSKRSENAYELKKLGCFPNVPRPKNSRDENPKTSMPLWGRRKKDDVWPAYEEQICRIYRNVRKKMQD